MYLSIYRSSVCFSLSLTYVYSLFVGKSCLKSSMAAAIQAVVAPEYTHFPFPGVTLGEDGTVDTEPSFKPIACLISPSVTFPRVKSLPNLSRRAGSG